MYFYNPNFIDILDFLKPLNTLHCKYDLIDHILPELYISLICPPTGLHILFYSRRTFAVPLSKLFY